MKAWNMTYQNNSIRKFETRKQRLGEVNRLIEDSAKARLCAEIAAFSLGIKEDILQDTRGKTDEAFARQIAMYLCHVGFQIPLYRVAAAFGRDRSTIAHACHLIEDRRDNDVFDRELDKLEEILNQVPNLKMVA